MTVVEVVEVNAGDSLAHSTQSWLDASSRYRTGTSISLHGSEHDFAFSTEGTGRTDENWHELVAPYGPVGASYAGYPLQSSSSGRRQFRVRFSGHTIIRKARFWIDNNVAAHWDYRIGVAATPLDDPVMHDASLFVGDPLPSGLANLMEGYATTDPWDTGLTVAPEIVGSGLPYLSPVITIEALTDASAFGPPFGYDGYGLPIPLALKIAWMDSQSDSA